MGVSAGEVDRPFATYATALDRATAEVNTVDLSTAIGGAAERFHAAYQPTPDAATLRRARGWAVPRALSGILIGDAGVHGRRGGKPTWAHRPTPHCDASSLRPLADQSLPHAPDDLRAGCLGMPAP